MDGRGQWSTLEPVHQQYDGPQAHDGLETYNHDGLQNYNGPERYTDGLHVAPPATLPQDTKAEATYIATPAPPYNDERRIWGLKRKVFIILAAIVALLVVGAAVGGAVGGTVGKSKSTTSASTSASPTTTGPSSSTPTSVPAYTILNNSSLGSANWTDSKGYSHHVVAYQGQYNSLLISLYDSQNTTWAVKNISSSLNSTFAALPGTPLSFAVTSYPWPFQLNLYYLSTSNQILELFTLDSQGEGWAAGSMSTYKLQAGSGSQLASYWQRCNYQCSQQIMVLYEDENQKLQLANGSDWSKPSQIAGTAINQNSGLALVPLAPSSDPNNEPYQLRAYVDLSSTSQEWMWTGYAGKGSWYYGGLSTLALPSPAPKYAATSFGTPSQGYQNIILTFLFSNGSISANWFDNTNWHYYITPTPTMPQSNFSAIAMNLDLRFYGLSAGTIYEYSIDGTNPFVWHYVNPVNTTFTTT